MEDYERLSEQVCMCNVINNLAVNILKTFEFFSDELIKYQ